ncbi:hypothetical protein [Bradyrhizobium ivorense]|uniref:hypothetical protein n=1 Tax=Bradyrhizobium ivorense TaxID=2511166 RepID=UPI001116760A|nr:hypothetical protein [Bradyrhizobium ivorense]
MTWMFLLMSGPSYGASEEFPAQLRGLWGQTKEACDDWKIQTVPDVGGDLRWLKISAAGVFGSTQGRFLRSVVSPAVDVSVEIQTLDSRGAIVLLRLPADGRLRETLLGAGGREIAAYQRC